MGGRIWREYNPFLLGCVAILLVISVVAVYSATLNSMTAYGTPLSVLFPRHLINIAVGVLVMIWLTLLDYRTLASLAIPMYIGSVAILGAVLLLGQVSEGAQSWLVLGTRTLQPSEFVKLALMIVLAAYWAALEDRRQHWLVQAGALVLMSGPMLLVLVQPDLGTTVVFAVIWLCMAWGAGIRWWQLATVIILTVPAAWFGWNEVLNDYQHTRLLTFYWLLNDPQQVDPDAAYNIIQSLNAIRAGGLFGAGFTEGLLSQGNYIPVQYTDFLFAVIAEELGFVGGTVLILFQALLLWLTLNIAHEAGDLFGRLLALGIFGMFLSHMLVNIGMTMSILPVTGLPMPFVSYGGSFMITSLAAIGLLQSIRLYRHRLTFY